MTRTLKMVVRGLAKDVGIDMGLGQALLVIWMGFFALTFLGLTYVSWLQAVTLVDYVALAGAIVLGICAVVATAILATARADFYGELGAGLFIFVCTSLALVIEKQWLPTLGLSFLALLVGLVHTWWRDGGGYEWAHRNGGAV